MRRDFIHKVNKDDRDIVRRVQAFRVPPSLTLLILAVLLIAVVSTSINNATAASLIKKGEATPAPQATAAPAGNESPAPTAPPEPEGVTGAGRGTESSEPEPTAQPTAAPVKSTEGMATESLGGVLVVGDTAYEYYNFNRSAADSYISILNSAADSLAGKANFYEMVVPTSMGVLFSDEDNERFGSDNQKKAIDYIYGSLNENVKTIDLWTTLKANADKYIYFRTDHHWTDLGAYYAYRTAMEASGNTPLELSQYTKKEYTGYLGSFYEQSENNPALGNNPDTVEAYIPPDEVTMNITQKDGVVLEDWPMIADAGDYGASEKYIAFIGGDQPYTEISNPNASTDKSCILIKESFGNVFAPYLTSNYQNVYIIDYRYYSGKIQDLVEEKGVSDVFVLNNMSATRNEDLVESFGTIF